MNPLLTKINANLNEYYGARLRQPDASVKVGWKNEQAQLSRFRQLAKVIEHGSDEAFSINDLGCGLGGFSDFLVSSGFNHCKYFGYDVFERMVEESRKVHANAANRSFIKINEANDMRCSDYTVASGVLNLKFTIPEHEWLYYVLETINAMHSRSIRGFAFNVLTRYSDKEFMKSELYYADPCFLFDYCKRNLSKDVALLHDYREYDFTIIVRKA